MLKFLKELFGFGSKDDAEKAVKPAKKAAVKKPAAMKAPAKRGPKKAK